MKLWGSVMLAIAAALPVGACAGVDSPRPSPPPTAIAGIQQVPVELRAFEFKPYRFTFKQAETVQFVLTSADIIHTFTVRDLGIDWAVAERQTQLQTFTFDRAGTFRLVCAIPSHERFWMIGEITVE